MAAVGFKARWSVLMVVLSTLAVSIAGVVYTNSTVRNSERKWCSIITSIDDRNTQQPPNTPAGQQFAQDIHKLRTDYHC